MSHSIYATLKAHYEGRKDKNAQSRGWNTGAGVTMDGGDVVVGWSSWTNVNGRYKRAHLRSKMILVTPDDVVSLHPDVFADGDRQVRRSHANLFCEVISVYKGNNKSVASDPLHVGPKQIVRIGGKVYGLDGNLSVRFRDFTREVLTCTPITRRKTDRTKARGAYKLSTQVAEMAAFAARFNIDELLKGRLWEGAAHRQTRIPALARLIHHTAGGTFEFDPSAQPEHVAELIDLITLETMYRMPYDAKRSPAVLENLKLTARKHLLKHFKEIDGYAPAE